MSMTITAEASGRVHETPLRIAMVAPPYFGVPPEGYGGVEAVIASLVDSLVDRGHHVTLLAAGHNGTRAQRFVRTFAQPSSVRLGDAVPEVVNAARVAQRLACEEVDLVHDHTLAGALLAIGRRTPTVVTVHGPTTDLAELYRPLGKAVQLVAISDAQRAVAPDLNWIATVHNGIDVLSYPFVEAKLDYAVFLGRYHPEKAPHLAIDAARAAGVPILLAGKCTEPVEIAYYEREIRPRLGPDVIDTGPADATRKRRILAEARVLLFPLCWEEPFGLVMAEALACGTPVVALRRGSVAEVVVHGVTGIVVDTPDELPAAIHRAALLDPRDCRADVATRFAAETMADGYEAAYHRVLAPTSRPVRVAR
ncbi:glycosyltransferase family 4 protein [Intrasporangium oryzae]|uniref:glycosyltransferase family 4 protein n=1 Tax=Intrasporangium oryzae TaxID=412687 RepID=UPI0004B67590|nr:glycosyltransferase family 4 protein [Intrasporangium oryzae]